MANYAVLDASGTIVNRIALDSAADWTPSPGQSIVEEKTAAYEIGGKIINGTYTAPSRPVAPPPPTFDAFDTWDAVSAKIAFNHENRIRALEGKTAVTAAQFKAAVKALIA